MSQIEAINQKQLKKVPDLKPGDTVKVHTKIIEGSKERIQIFEGVVLRVKGGGIKQTFTVRKLSYGIGVERTFLTHSPKIAKIIIVKRANVRRAYLTYLRDLRGKAAKLKDKGFDALTVNIKDEPVATITEVEASVSDETKAENGLDGEITEINPEGVEIVDSVSTEEIAEAETAESAEDAGDRPEDLGAEHQMIEVSETDKGLDKSEAEEEKGKEMK